MSPDLFPKYLKDPSLLYRISYEELKTLVMQYPYSQNLRYLLLLKSRMDRNDEQERNLEMTAAYTLDRNHLYQLLQGDFEAIEQIDFEFLNLEHAISDEENAELELPVLDFSKGIRHQEKQVEEVKDALDLSQKIETNIGEEDDDDEEEELLDLFDEALEEEEVNESEDELENESVSDFNLIPPSVPDFSFVKQTTASANPIDNSFGLPMVPPAVVWEISTEDILPEVVNEHLVLPLVPPQVDISSWKSIEMVQELVAFDQFPLVPPAIILLQQDENEEIIPDLSLPLVPPIVHWQEQTLSKTPLLKTVQEDVETEEEDFASEIDASIQEALSKLATEQQIEQEKEEQEDIDRIRKVVEVELEQELEEAQENEDDKEDFQEEVIPTLANDGPMPKASFSSWLKRMQSPSPDKDSIPEKPKEKSIFKQEKKKEKKKKKKKSTPIDNEGSRLLKAIKAKQLEERKAETEQMLIRKRRVIELAERSLKENEEVISFTLAKILLIQGKKSKALGMYRQLMLKFPEKSSFFAAEIEKIQKKN